MALVLFQVLFLGGAFGCHTPLPFYFFIIVIFKDAFNGMPIPH